MVAIQLVSTLLLLEVVLQVLALGNYWLDDDQLRITLADSEAVRILCVGDSYTFGDGASDPAHSYPAALEKLLASRYGITASVVNSGRMGRDSNGLLRNLESTLQQVRPHVVCILVGTNDGWSHPQRLERDRTNDPVVGFEWKWRSGRLAQLLFGHKELDVANLPERRPPAPSIISTGEDASVAEPTAAMFAAAAAFLGDAGIVFHDTRPLPPMPREPELDAALNDVYRIMNEQRFAEGLAACDRLLVGNPSDPTLHQLACRAAAFLEQRARAEQEAEWLQARHAAAPSAYTAEAVLCALWDLGRFAEVARIGPELLESFPTAQIGWLTLSNVWTRLDATKAPATFERFFDTAGPLRAWHQFAISDYARLVAATDPGRAARLLSAALLLRGERASGAWANYQLTASSGLIRRQHMEPTLDRPELDERGRALLRGAFSAVFEGSAADWEATLEHHLHLICEIDRAANARTVLLTYPFLTQSVTAIQHRVAAQERVPIVPVGERFARELESRRREELFVADGHCNDAGYAILAEEVAKVLGPYLK